MGIKRKKRKTYDLSRRRKILVSSGASSRGTLVFFCQGTSGVLPVEARRGVLTTCSPEEVEGGGVGGYKEKSGSSSIREEGLRGGERKGDK